MKVMIRMKNSSFLSKWSNFSNFLFKISNQSHFRFHRLLLRSDVSVSAYCDDKYYLLRQLLVGNIVEDDQKEKKKEEENGKNSIKKTSERDVSVDAYCDDKLNLLRQIANSMVEENDQKEEGNGRDSIKKNSEKHSGKLDLLKQLKAFDFSEEEEDISKIKKSNLDDTGKNLNEILHGLEVKTEVNVEIKAETEKHYNPQTVSMATFKNLLDKIDVEELINDAQISKSEEKIKRHHLQEAFNDAIQFVINSKEFISLNHLIWISTLLFEIREKWTNYEKMEFITSAEFQKLKEIFLRFIPETSNYYLIWRFLPLFSKVLQLPSEDIIFYELFKKISNESKMLTCREKIRVIMDRALFQDLEIYFDLRKLLLSELERSYLNGDPNIHCLPLRFLLFWAKCDSTPENIKITALEKLLFLPNRERDVDSLAKYFRILYSLKDETRKERDHLESEGIKEVNAFLLKDPKYYNTLCSIVSFYGNAVNLEKTKMDGRFVDNVLNAFAEFKPGNIPLNHFNHLILGVRRMRHLNYQFVDYVGEFLINNFEAIEKNSSLLYRITRMLADCDFPSKSEEWPFVKILLENIKLSNIVHRFKHSPVQSSNHLVSYAYILSTMGVYPGKILDKISKLCSDKKVIMAMSGYELTALLELNRAVYYLHSKNGSSLLTEEILQLALDRRFKLINDVPGYQLGFEKFQKLKMCLEEAAELKGFLLPHLLSKFGLRAPLVMVFDQENKPCCLEGLQEKGRHIEDLNFPAESKIVVVRIITPQQYFEDSNGNRINRSHYRQKGQIFKKLGFLIVEIENETLTRLSDDMLGHYAYDQIKNTIAQSSVDQS